MGKDKGAEMRWTPHTIAVWQKWTCGEYTAFKRDFNGPWHLMDGDRNVVFTDPMLQTVMAEAQAIEARRAETGTGSVHESAVRKDAPDNDQETTDAT